MKNDPKEHAQQLSLDFDSPAHASGIDTPIRRTMVGLTLAYSAAPTPNVFKDISERDLIISETLSFARKLPW
jgi:hypothetical protein